LAAHTIARAMPVLPLVTEDDGIGFDLPGLFSGFDHRSANAVLDRMGRVVEFQLGDYLGRQSFCHALDAHQGGVADQISDVVCDFHQRFLCSWISSVF
jgi:hypothetical protein